ncbi:hypothetical protein CHARACLAT_000097 [Characodon lateralis]|uniref:Uncharacterized protein n=1 Tax=Characodon lateralis TaxID=208331 RepID=A0ABU7CJ75_9TELE|nr:hypothetical protein [Characodon lateralis]
MKRGRKHAASTREECHVVRVQHHGQGRMINGGLTHFNRSFHSGSLGSWCLSPSVYRREAGYTLDGSPVHRRATQRHSGQTTKHTPIHT